MGELVAGLGVGEAGSEGLVGMARWATSVTGWRVPEGTGIRAGVAAGLESMAGEMT
jgi:hypothetical protein